MQELLRTHLNAEAPPEECSKRYVRGWPSLLVEELVGGFQVRLTLEVLEVVETTFKSSTLSGAAKINQRVCKLVKG